MREKKMSGLEQKTKITGGTISIICANCNLDRTKDKNPLSTHCHRCGFNPSFPNIIAERLMCAEKEIAKLKGLLKNYNDQALAYEKSVEEKLGQIREAFQKCAYLDWELKPAFVCTICEFFHGIQKGCSWEKERSQLVGLLGQNSEKPEPKKGEKP